MFGLELWVVLARLSAVACALLSGYLLGRTAPDWRGDDETLRTHGGGMLGYYYRPQVLYGRGCFTGSWAAGLFAVAALVLLGFGWPEVLEGVGYTRRGSFMAVVFSGPFWLVVAAWFVGWGIGRFTDKGPVGPLE